MALPHLLAFLASFCIMVVELIGGRIIAADVGASLYTWTSVIGIVLGGITLGNLVGGRVADRYAPRRSLAVLFLVASAACLVIPTVNYVVGRLDALEEMGNWPLRVFLHVTLVFSVPATALGLIGPVVAKLALDRGLRPGRTVGDVYAAGALGSILGTLATGFYLIATFGISAVVWSVAAILAMVGLALWRGNMVGRGVAAILIVSGLVPLSPWQLEEGGIVRRVECLDCLYNRDSQYSRVRILEDQTDGTRRMALDSLVHAYFVPTDIADLRYGYEQTYAVATQRFAAHAQPRAFFIGGGGYIFPRYLKQVWPDSFLEVAEIDPTVTDAATTAFGLFPSRIVVRGGPGAALAPGRPAGFGPDGPPIAVYHLDARNRIDDILKEKRRGGTFEPFDYVYGDAFNHYSVPFQLVTQEFFTGVRELLRPGTGLYLMNVIDKYESSRFLGALYNTLRRVFPEVYILARSRPAERPGSRDTYVLIGSLRPLDTSLLQQREGEEMRAGLPITAEELATIEERSRGMILTDDYAPVENLLAPIH